MGVMNLLMVEVGGVSVWIEIGDGKLHELNDDIF